MGGLWWLPSEEREREKKKPKSFFFSFSLFSFLSSHRSPPSHLSSCLIFTKTPLLKKKRRKNQFRIIMDSVISSSSDGRMFVLEEKTKQKNNNQKTARSAVAVNHTNQPMTRGSRSYIALAIRPRPASSPKPITASSFLPPFYPSSLHPEYSNEQ